MARRLKAIFLTYSNAHNKNWFTAVILFCQTDFLLSLDLWADEKQLCPEQQMEPE